MAPRELLLLLGAVLGSSLDVDSPVTFMGDPRGGFGASVAQFGTSDDGWVLVGAPQDGEGSGALFRCRVRDGTCTRVPIRGPSGAPNGSLGLALAAGPEQVVVCAPTAPQACGQNLHLRGFCLVLDSTLQPIRSLPDPPPECPKSSSDVAFLVDGSGSIGPDDFGKMKTFIVEVMRRFRGTDTQFALTQFSHLIRDHFDFRTFRRFPDPAQLLEGVEQLRGQTHTASAMRHVLLSLFGPGRGARPGATKILIVVTDGRKFGDRLGYDDVIPLANGMGVTRYGIGVGGAFSDPQALRELQGICSSPPHEHLFRVDNFDALRGIQEQLQEKIFAIEGTHSGGSSSFQLEMAQEGLSALVTPDGPALGAVGAFDWSGGVFLYGGGGAAAFVNATSDSDGGGTGGGGTGGGGTDTAGAYLGYSLATVPLRGSRGVAVGAPRFAHVGRVVVFVPTQGGTWRVLGDVTGTQVGSYFGSALLALDADADGAAELLLVGAPHWHGGGSGGRVQVCQLQGRSLRCPQVLRGVPGHPLGRFGASLAHLGDLDGSGWAQVAVGAPLEDEGGGAVYLFRARRGGVEPGHCQRIPGGHFPTLPRLLGRSLSGGRDLSGDRLADLAVGAEGQVLLLRAPPLLRLGLSVSFSPRVVPASSFECPEGAELGGHPLGTARLCFLLTKGTPDGFGSLPEVSLSVRTELDPARPHPRGVFPDGTPTQNLTLRGGAGRHCRTLELRFKECPRDTLTPLILRVTLEGRGHPLPVPGGLRPALSPDSDTATSAALPFERDCGPDNVCWDELSVSLNFSGLSALLVGVGDPLDVTVTLRNDGESSFGATSVLGHPPGLSYRKVVLRESSRPGSLRCHSEPPQGQSRRTLCQVHHPVLRPRAQVTFTVTLDVPPDAELGDTLEVTANATSSNEGSGGRGQRAELPVRYQVLLGLGSSPDSTRSISVPSGGGPSPHNVTHRYQLQILGSRGVESNVTFRVPSSLGGSRLWDHLGVTPEQAQVRCQEGPEFGGAPQAPPPPSPPEGLLLDCHVTSCREFLCWVPPRDPPQNWGFRVGGTLRVGGEGQPPKFLLQSSGQVQFDLRRFHNTWGGTEAQVQTELELLETPRPLPLILGGSLGGLLLLGLVALGLHKVGFFKRPYKELLEGGEGPPQDPPPGPPPGPPN